MMKIGVENNMKNHDIYNVIYNNIFADNTYVKILRNKYRI